MWVRRFDKMPADQTGSTVLLGRSLRHRNNGYVGAAFGFGVEFNATVTESEQSVILTHSDVGAGMPLGTALTRKNVAGNRRLPAEQFDTEATARGGAAVAG
jgi:hypothetical protein